MLFNPDPSKAAQKVVFSRKNQIQNHPVISLNNGQVPRSSYQKHVGIMPDEKTSTYFATEIISHNLQSFFKTST